MSWPTGVGLFAGIRFAALFGEVALRVVGERRFVTHGVNLPDRAVERRLVVRLPLAEDRVGRCGPGGGGVNLFPLRRVAHLTVVSSVRALVVYSVDPFRFTIVGDLTMVCDIREPANVAPTEFERGPAGTSGLFVVRILFGNVPKKGSMQMIMPFGTTAKRFCCVVRVGGGWYAPCCQWP